MIIRVKRETAAFDPLIPVNLLIAYIILSVRVPECVIRLYQGTSLARMRLPTLLFVAFDLFKDSDWISDLNLTEIFNGKIFHRI